MNDDGIEKGAILLLSIGEESATEVFKHLGPREVQKLGMAMSNLKSVTRERSKACSARLTPRRGKISPRLNSGSICAKCSPTRSVTTRRQPHRTHPPWRRYQRYRRP